MRLPWWLRGIWWLSSVQFSCSVMSNSLRPMDYSTPGLPVHHQLPELTQTHVCWVSDTSNHLILCRPLLLPPSIFPSIRVFSNKSVLLIRWPKFWNFSFSISLSDEHSGLISFRMDWLDLQNISIPPKGNLIPTKQFLPISPSCKSLGTTNLWFCLCRFIYSGQFM